MDSQNLTTFLAVAETGSFSLAGEKLHLTQPAVSKRIALLENQLEIRLFDRIGRSIRPTEAGILLIERARHILKDIDDTRLALTNLSGHVAGKLSIATSHHIGLHRLPPILKEFSSRYPNVSLDIRFVDSEWAYSAVQQGKIELGIITLSPQPSSNQFITKQIWQDPLVFVAAKEHPLSQQHNLTLSDISQYPAVFPGDNTFTKKIVLKHCQAMNLDLNISMESNYLETLKMMVSIGLAWSVLPKTMLDDTLRDITPEGTSINRKLGYLHHQNRTLSNAGKALIQLLEQVTTSTVTI